MMKFVILILILSIPAWANRTLSNRDIELINSKANEYRHYMNSRDHSKAFIVLKDLQSKFPNLEHLKAWWASYYRVKGKIYHKQKNFYQSVVHFEKAFKHQPDENNLVLLATAYMDNRQFFDATNFLESNPHLVSDRNRLVYKEQIALGYEKMENFEGAIYQTKQLIDLEPNNPEHWSNLARFYLKNNQPDETTNTLDRLSKFRPLTNSELFMKRQASQKQQIGNQVESAISSSFEIQIDKEKYRKHIPLILSYLDEAYIELGRIFDFYPRHKTRVNILTEQNYTHVADNKSSIGMRTLNSDEIYIRLDKNNNFSQPHKLRNTIWHEYNHHIFMLKTRGLGESPRWFIEGIAMYLEPKELAVRDQKIIDTLIKSKSLFTGENLPAHMTNYQMYLMARSMIALLDKQGHLGGIVQNLGHLTFSYSFAELFQELTGKNQMDFTDEWNAYLTSNFSNRNSN